MIRILLFFCVVYLVILCNRSFGQSTVGTSSFSTMITIPTGLFPVIVKTADFDKDGKIDIVVANETSNSFSIYQNQTTNNTLTSSSFLKKIDILIGDVKGADNLIISDIDQNGLPDIVLTTYYDSFLYFFKNTSTSGQISFAAPIKIFIGLGKHDLAIGDIDVDGYPDLAVSNYSAGTITLFKTKLSGGQLDFQNEGDLILGDKITSIKLCDLNGDQKPELIATVPDRGAILIFPNIRVTGDLNLTSFGGIINLKASTDAFTLKVGDINNDGKPEILVNNIKQNTISIYKNNSNLSGFLFDDKLDYSVGGHPGDFIIKDIDQDGLMDILVLNLSSQGGVYILHCISSSLDIHSFEAVNNLNTGNNPQSIAVADFDGDSRLDIALVNSGDNTISLYKNYQISSVFPVITSVFPNSGSPGTVINITGINFIGAIAVSIGGSSAITYNVNSDNSITATVGSGNTGLINVTTLKGTTNYSSFTFTSGTYYGILDQLKSSARSAYSLRKLKSNYTHQLNSPLSSVDNFKNSTNPAVRVRRSIDNALLDVGFTVSGDLDTTTLKGFVGNGNGYVTVWYDQSGHSLDAFQTDTTKQPRLVFGGVIDRDGGHPTLIYSGNQWFNTNYSLERDTVPNLTINMVYRPTAIGAGNMAIWGGDNGNWDRFQLLNYDDSPGIAFGISNGGTAIPQPLLNHTGKIVYTAVLNNSVSNGSRVYANSTPGDPFTEQTGDSFSTLQIGAIGTDHTPAKITSQEFISFNSDITNDRLILENNQEAYYLAQKPVIAAVYPATAIPGMTVEIDGSNLQGATSVSFGGTLASSFTVNPLGNITATIAIGSSGTLNVTTVGGSAVFPGFNIVAPPHITYTQPSVFLVGTAINSLKPANSGGNVPPIIYGRTTTIAGNAYTPGRGNGPNGSATFNTPFGSAVDKLGNIYVADSKNNQIRKISVDGNVSTYAGSGLQGSSDGPSATASFNSPQGIAFDLPGNLYVTDVGNNLIRKITPDGVVTTLAGSGHAGDSNGKGISASFNSPFGIVVDRKGVIFFTDALNNQVKMITPDSVVSTFAGSSQPGNSNGQRLSASFRTPSGITIDPKGNLIIADKDNGMIRKIDTNGLVSNKGSNGSRNGFFYDPIAVVSDPTGNIYVCDIGHFSIFKIDTMENVTSLAGHGYNSISDGIGAEASFNVVTGISIDQKGNLYVSEYLGQVIRKIETWGYHISPDLPSGLVLDGSTGLISGTPSNTLLTTNYAVTAFNLAGASMANLQLRVDISAPNIHYLADRTYSPGLDPGPLPPVNIGGAVQQKGLFTTLAGTGNISAINGVGNNASFNTPYATVPDKKGNVYVVDYGSNFIRKISSQGIVSTVAGTGVQGMANGPAHNASFNHPSGIAIDTSGNLYIADQYNHQVRKMIINGQDTSVITLAGSVSIGSANGSVKVATLNSPFGIVVNQAGEVFVSDAVTHLIRKIKVSGQDTIVSTIAGSGTAGSIDGPSLSASFNTPLGIALDTAGNLIIADYNNHKIRKLNLKNDSVTTVAGSGSAGHQEGNVTTSSFNYPAAIAVDRMNNIYVSDLLNQCVREISLGMVSTLAYSDQVNTVSDGNGSFITASYPTGISIDQSGNLFVAEQGSHKIRKIVAFGYRMEGTLPNGLNFDNGTGIITGSPTVAPFQAIYKITAFNAGGSSTTLLNLSVTNSSFLDKIAGLNAPAQAAFSVRALKSIYSHTPIVQPILVTNFNNSTSPLVRIRRSGDNAQLDIGADSNGNLDLVSLESFVKAADPHGSGYVSVWYDQSGYSNDAVQLDTARQPRLVYQGKTDQDNGVPAMVYSGNQFLTTPLNFSRKNVPYASISMVYRSTNITSGNRAIWGADNGNYDRFQLMRYDAYPAFNFGVSNGTNVTIEQGTVTTDQIIYTGVFQNNVNNGSNVFVNGVGSTPFTENTGDDATYLQIGAIGGGNYSAQMKNHEFICFYQALADTDRHALENSQTAFYFTPPALNASISTNSFVTSNLLDGEWKQEAPPGFIIAPDDGTTINPGLNSGPNAGRFAYFATMGTTTPFTPVNGQLSFSAKGSGTLEVQLISSYNMGLKASQTFNLTTNFQDFNWQVQNLYPQLEYIVAVIFHKDAMGAQVSAQFKSNFKLNLNQANLALNYTRYRADTASLIGNSDTTWYGWSNSYNAPRKKYLQQSAYARMHFQTASRQMAIEYVRDFFDKQVVNLFPANNDHFSSDWDQNGNIVPGFNVINNETRVTGGKTYTISGLKTTNPTYVWFDGNSAPIAPPANLTLASGYDSFHPVYQLTAPINAVKLGILVQRISNTNNFFDPVNDTYFVFTGCMIEQGAVNDRSSSGTIPNQFAPFGGFTPSKISGPAVFINGQLYKYYQVEGADQAQSVQYLTDTLPPGRKDVEVMMPGQGTYLPADPLIRRSGTFLRAVYFNDANTVVSPANTKADSSIVYIHDSILSGFNISSDAQNNVWMMKIKRDPSYGFKGDIFSEGYAGRILHTNTKTPQLLEAFAQKLARFGVDKYWFQIGVNDYGFKTPLDSFYREFKTLVERAKTLRPSARFYIQCTGPEIYEGPNGETNTDNGLASTGPAANDFRDVQRALATSHAYCEYVDFEGLFSPTLDNLSDGIHPTDLGNKLYSDGIRDKSTLLGTIPRIKPLIFYRNNIRNLLQNVPGISIITGDGGNPPYAFSLSSGSDTLTMGLTFNPDGTITGTPASVGNFNLRVNLSDQAGHTTQQTFILTVNPTPSIVVAPLHIQDAQTGIPYAKTLKGALGYGPYVLSTDNNNNLPPGLTYNPQTGLLSGTPNAAGTYHFTISASDHWGFNGTTDYTLNVSDRTPAKLTDHLNLTASIVNGNLMVNAHLHDLYSTTYFDYFNAYVTQDNGERLIGGNNIIVPYNHFSGDAVNAGIIDTATYGPVTSIRLESPNSSIDTNFRQSLDNVNINFDINSITDLYLYAGLNSPYSKNFSSAWGEGNYTFNQMGQLPTGISFNSETGILSGNPSVTGSFPFKVSVTDRQGFKLVTNYTLQVDSGARPLPVYHVSISGGFVGDSLVVGARLDKFCDAGVSVQYRADVIQNNNGTITHSTFSNSNQPMSIQKFNLSSNPLTLHTLAGQNIDRSLGGVTNIVLYYVGTYIFPEDSPITVTHDDTVNLPIP